MAGMFENCCNLEKLNLSNFNTAKVKTMASMFKNCSDLDRINLSSFHTEKVTNMSSMFENCHDLEILDLSSFNTVKVSNMKKMFGGYAHFRKILRTPKKTGKCTTSLGMNLWINSKGKVCRYLPKNAKKSITLKSIDR